MTVNLSNSNFVTGCIDTAADGENHQLQLWIERNQGGFVYVIRSQYQPGGRVAKRCVLDSGSTNPNYEEVVAAGQSAFARMKPAGDVAEAK